jgi:hypothetical protein
MDTQNKKKLDSLPSGSRIRAMSDEFGGEFIKNKAGKWIRLGGQGEDPSDYEDFEVAATHTLSTVPTDLERVAVNFLRRYQEHCEHTGIRDEIEKTLRDPEYQFNALRFFGDLDEPHSVWSERFNTFEEDYRRIGFNWAAYHFLDAIGKYREMGRPSPCPNIADDIGGIAIAETTGGFLTAKIVETEAEFISYLQKEP